MNNRSTKYLVGIAATLATLFAGAAWAHHSFAMYDQSKVYIITGVVTRVDPNPNHLQVFVVPLNQARDQIIRDSKGEPWVWSVEMESAPMAARKGITVNNFPRGTIMSVGVHPLRNGFPGGGRGKNGVFKCPTNATPVRGKHCDSVEGATSHGDGVLPAQSDPLPSPMAQQ